MADRPVTYSAKASTLMQVNDPYLGRRVPPPHVPQPIYVVPQQPTSGLAVTSLVLSILGLVGSCCTFGILSLGAVIFGHVALAETKSGQKRGHGMAVAGLIMGYVFFLPAILFSLWMVMGAGLAAITPTPATSPTP